MKKILLALLAATSFSFASQAQDLSFIVQGGYQGAQLTNFKAQELASGFRIGAALDWEFVDLGIVGLSLQPGVNFSQKGANYILGTAENGGSILTLVNDPSLHNAINAAMKMSYIDIPVLLNACFDVPVIGNLFVQAGPYVGFGIGSSTKFTTSNDTMNNLGNDILNLLNGNQKFDVFKDNVMDKFDYGLQFGGGIEFNHFLLSAGYQLGLKNLKTENKTLSENVDQIGQLLQKTIGDGTKNSSFYVSVGYRF